MDINPTTEELTPEILSYDDSIPYPEQVAQLNASSDATEPFASSGAHSRLADRIGNTKVYLLPETATTRAGKVRW